MISSFPGGCFVFFRNNLSPLLGGPVEHRDSVESLLVGSSTSKNYNLIGLRVVVKSAVGSMRRTFSMSVNLIPSFVGSVICPEVIHIVGV